MNTTPEPPGAASIVHSITRIAELEAVLSALEHAWDRLDDGARRAIVSDVRRGLVDTACTLDPH
ncbi:hypothetical protein [Orrella marina]|nr:hypothetical protein [Orrella marina]